MKSFRLPATPAATVRAACAAAAVVVLAACGAEPSPDRQPGAAPAPGEAPAPPTRADVISDTLLIEGMAEPTMSQLVQSPADAAVAFSTYVPEGVQAETVGTGDTVSVRFVAAFTGTADPNAFMHVRFYAPGVDLVTAREMLMQFILSRVPDDAPVTGTRTEQLAEPRDAPPWAEEAWGATYRGEGNRMYTATARLAQHGGRIFHVITHYPAEYGDGLAPRFQRILDHWRWDDTGEMLTGSGPAAGR